MTDITDLNFKERLKNIKAFVFDVDGVLSTSIVNILPDGELGRTANVKDGYAIVHALKKGFYIGIISGGKSEWVVNRFKALGVKDVYINSQDKMHDFNDFIVKRQLQSSEILYMGDDIPDIKVMKHCGVSTCPADAVEEVKAVSLYISSHKGGEGCVRDIISQTLKTQNKWYKK